MKFVDGSFFLFNENNIRLTFFTLLDLSMYLLWIIIILVIAFYLRSQRDNINHYKYFFKGLMFKLVFSLFFSLVYILYYNGGDSIVFWDGAVCMKRLFFEDPLKYINELFLNFNPDEARNPFQVYSKTTGYPSWPAMYEKESYVVIKITSFFTFFTGGSYLAINAILALLSFLASWRLFTYLRTFVPITDKNLAFCIFFIPTVSFWTSAVSKDAYLFISMLVLIRLGFKLLRKEYSSLFWTICLIAFHVFLILQIRSIILATLMVPFFIAVGNKYASRFKENKGFHRFVQLFIYGVSIIFFFAFASFSESSSKIDEYMKEAEVTQQDFLTNETYTGKKYTIEIVDFSPVGLIRAMPESIVAGLYRPFPWEALSPNLLLNGLESIVFLFFTWKFIKNSFWKKWKILRKNEFLLFSLVFVLLFAFITGFSSIIFGVLVRLRAPLLIFFAMLLLIDPEYKASEQIS